MPNQTHTLVKWDNSWNTGHEEIDAEHKGLVECINRVFTALCKVDIDDNIANASLDLQKYTYEHFRREEMLMKDFGHTNIVGHTYLHDEFITEIAKIFPKYIDTRMTQNSNKELYQIIAFLKNWLIHHIIDVDKPMVSKIFLRQSNVTTEKT